LIKRNTEEKSNIAAIESKHPYALLYLSVASSQRFSTTIMQDDTQHSRAVPPSSFASVRKKCQTPKLLPSASKLPMQSLLPFIHLHVFPAKAFKILSGVIGKSWILTPMAL
jgi:hypothetical protein